MEIKTTEEIELEEYELAECNGTDGLNWDLKKRKDYKNKKWVAVDEIIADLKERKISVENAMGNEEDKGYLKAIECLLDYYEDKNGNRK